MHTKFVSVKYEDGKAVPVTVHTNILPLEGRTQIEILGLSGEAETKSRLHVISSLMALGYQIPEGRIFINVTPDDNHKDGSNFALAMLLGILASSGHIKPIDDCRFALIGDLNVGGELQRVVGDPTAIAMAAEKMGLNGCILPYEDAVTAAEKGVENVYGIHNIYDAMDIVCGNDRREELRILLEFIPDLD